jgi:hypothetical protein
LLISISPFIVLGALIRVCMQLIKLFILIRRSNVISLPGYWVPTPISPLIFCIVSDLLVAAVNRTEGVEDMSAFMDDLGIVIIKRETFGALEGVFEKYERSTGARLNYEKCIILTNEKDFKPEGKWSRMPEGNRRARRAKYLGVPVALEVDPVEDWRPTVGKFGRVCQRIRRIRCSITERCRMINQFALPVLEYVGCFRIMNEEVGSKVWRHLRSAMSGRANIPLRALMTQDPRVRYEKPIHHPAMRNWALLASKKPTREMYMNPF